MWRIGDILRFADAFAREAGISHDRAIKKRPGTQTPGRFNFKRRF
jgi:hypothetical protein